MPKEIINNPRKLDEQEWAIIKTHTIEGQRMLEKIGGFMSEIGRIVRASHERWDGSGYPDGLRGETIPLEARIVSTCDAFNAMTTTRSYRTAMSFADAAAELERCVGSHFDPAMVRALLDVVITPAAKPARADDLRERSPASGDGQKAHAPVEVILTDVPLPARKATVPRLNSAVSRASRAARRAPRRVA